MDVGIRYAVQAPPVDETNTFLDLARKAEDLGFYALYVADHIGVTANPSAALAAAASVTSTVRLGTYVCNAAIRDPLSLASGAATVDLLSDGRMILGLGAGHTPTEWTMIGRPYPTAGAHVRHLAEVVDVVTALPAGRGRDLRRRVGNHREAFLLSPQPVQDEIPLLIGGSARRRRADDGGRAAHMAGLYGLGRTLADGHRHRADWSPNLISTRVALVRNAATNSAAPPVLDALVQHLQITDDRDTVAARVASNVGGVTAADVVAAPYVLVGSLDQIIEELATHREHWVSRRTSFAPAIDARGAADRTIPRALAQCGRAARPSARRSPRTTHVPRRNSRRSLHPR